MLEINVEEEEGDQTQGIYGKFNKCFVEMNYDKNNKNRKICRGCYNENRTKLFVLECDKVNILGSVFCRMQ